MRLKNQKTCRAFTLVELLVTIGIIAILASLLAVGISTAKAKAKVIPCLNNLHQLQLAWLMYANDHNDMMVRNDSEDYGGVWRSTVDSWVAENNARYDSDPAGIQKGLLFPYTKELKLYRCPYDTSVITGQNVPRLRSYSMNDYLGHPDSRTLKKISDIPRPTSTFVFLDENEDSIDDAHFLVWDAPDDRWVNMPTDRHARGCTFSFADHHVEHIRWKWNKGFKNKKTYYKRAENEQDLADLRKLQSIAK